jgi:hypothetical protein
MCDSGWYGLYSCMGPWQAGLVAGDGLEASTPWSPVRVLQRHRPCIQAGHLHTSAAQLCSIVVLRVRLPGWLGAPKAAQCWHEACVGARRLCQWRHRGCMM